MRSTRQKEVVLEVVRSTMAHPTADWIYREARRRLPRISLGTVYRNLRLLAEAGLIAELRYGKHPSRYEATLDRHYHIRCTRCGQVEDLALAPLRRLEQEAARLSRYEVWDHSVDLIGVCPRCRKASGRRQAPVSLTVNRNERRSKTHGESSSSSRGAGRHQRR